MGNLEGLKGKSWLKRIFIDDDNEVYPYFLLQTWISEETQTVEHLNKNAQNLLSDFVHFKVLLLDIIS